MSTRKPKKDWLKQLQKRKKKRFEGLRDKLGHGPFPVQEVVYEPAGKEKMSEVLEDFIEPYMGSVVDEASHRKLLSLGMLAWNAALLPDDKRGAMIGELVSRALPPGSDAAATDFRMLVDSLVERKLTHFATNTRAIISFELTDTGRDFHLSVASTL